MISVTFRVFIVEKGILGVVCGVGFSAATAVVMRNVRCGVVSRLVEGITGTCRRRPRLELSLLLKRGLSLSGIRLRLPISPSPSNTRY